MKKIIIVSMIAICISGCGKNKQEEYNSCVEKGIQYYKDIGSYPILKSENISAESKVKQMCSNSVVAFN